MLTPQRQVLLRELEAKVRQLEQANRELAGREGHVSTVFNACPAAIAVYRRSDRAFVEVNEAFVTLFGRTRDEVIGRTVEDLGLMDATTADRLCPRAGDFPSQHGEDVEMKVREGGTRHFTVSARCQDIGGEPHVVTTFSEVTARKSAEETQQANDARRVRQLDALVALTGAKADYAQKLDAILAPITETAARTLEVARVSVWRFSGDRTLLQCLNLYERDLERHSAGMELSGATYPRYFAALERLDVIAAHDAHVDPRTAEFSAAYLGPLGINAMLDAPIRAGSGANGVLCHEHTGPARIWTHDEQVFALAIANLVSLTLEGWERHRTAAELREAQQRLERAARAGNVGLWDWNLLTNETYYSTQWKQQLGYTDDEVMSTHAEWESRLHPDDRERALQTVQSYLAQPGPVFELETRLRHKDGTYRQIIARGSPILDESGGVSRLVGSHVDITEHAQLQSHFLQAQKMESVGTLAGGIAHDFNNLLTVINGTADLVLSDLADGDPLHEDLNQIRNAGQRAAALTRQLLAFSRKQILRAEVLDLNAVVADMHGMLQRLLGERIELVVRPAKGLAAVKADRGQIEQIVMNLSVNARDAMPEGGALTIETHNVDLDAEYAAVHPSAVPGPHVLLAVSDAGVGMDAETLTRIFEPFFTTKESGRGTGLGLSTVYGIVKQSGGTVWVYSEPGRGSTFKIYLPQVSERAQVVRAAPAAKTTRGTETILVVEDEESVRMLAARVLEAAGYTVLKAANAEEALALVAGQSGTVHLMLTDVVMPGMTGRELAIRLADSRPAMKVLYTSGYTDDVALRHGVIDDSAEFIGKPYTMSQLTRKVREVLDSTPPPVE